MRSRTDDPYPNHALTVCPTLSILKAGLLFLMLLGYPADPGEGPSVKMIQEVCMMNRVREKRFPLLRPFCFCILTVFASLLIAWLPIVIQAGEDGETRISGEMLGVDDKPLAGIIVIEKGRLYGKGYRYGGMVDENGRFSVRVSRRG
jgi:hypothetical protein